MTILFFSYSHRDETYRDELEVHLAMLKRQGVIDVWHDRRIMPGEDFGDAISEQLEHADIILLLVSPYFLASDYCYEREMMRAMERHAAGEARVIPVILEPCEWHEAPFGKLLAVPTDGKPVSKHPNRHDAFLEITKSVRRASAERGKGHARAAPRTAAPAAAAPGPRSSNLRIRKTFSDSDCDAFLDEAFDYLANFFEGSLRELQKRHAGISARFKRIDAARFTAHVYRDGESISQCSVRLGEPLGNGIVYSSDATATNSYNEALSVRDDGQTLLLKAMGMATFGGGQQLDSLTFEGAAEYLWEMLMRPLQR